MNHCISPLRFVVTALFLALSSGALAQTPLISLIDKSEDYIIENVEGYDFMEERGVEHEQFDVLVFGDKNRELSFFFTFYQGEKICNTIVSRAPEADFKEELAKIGSSFAKLGNDQWENADKTIRVKASEVNGVMTVVVSGAR